MKKIIKNNYKIIIGIIIGILISLTSVYAIEAYIESKKVSYDNHNKKITTKENVQEAIDELYERSGIHQDKWVDPVLNGADPVLKEPLIPVEIKPNGEVYYANENSEWYNYSEKRWANAIILTDTAKEYKDDKKYKVGDQIKEDDIESYFVWIPRYQYKIWNLANTEEYKKAISFSSIQNDGTFDDINSFSTMFGKFRIIDIQFGTYEKYPKMAESDASLNEYYTHPAFTLGDKNLNGIWVGKFETGGSTDSLIVKPNVPSLRSQTVKVLFETAKEYEISLDSHMMKNTEWGAVAYLSHSIYGISTEININNNSDHKTGYSAVANIDRTVFPGKKGIMYGATEDITQPWNTPTGYLASTTGNINGIYDMSGGHNEVMASYIKGNLKNSGFSDAEVQSNIIYFDVYNENTNAYTYTNRILGDATGEIGPFIEYKVDNGISWHNIWYNNSAYMAVTSSPWVQRGGGFSEGSYSGQFYFGWNTGSDSASFRLVLAI